MNVASQLQNRKRKKIDSYLDLFDKTILPVCTYNCELCYGMFLFSALNAHPMINYLPTLALATYQRSNTIARINQYLASQLSFLKHDIFLLYILFIDLFNYLFIFSKNKKINRIYQYDQFYRSCKILKKKGVPLNGVTLIGRVPLSNLLWYRSRSLFSLLLRLWKSTNDVRACVFICI